VGKKRHRFSFLHSLCDSKESNFKENVVHENNKELCYSCAILRCTRWKEKENEIFILWIFWLKMKTIHLECRLWPIHLQIMQNCNRKFQNCHTHVLFFFSFEGGPNRDQILCSTLQSLSNCSKFFKLYFYLLLNINYFTWTGSKSDNFLEITQPLIFLFSMLRIFSPAIFSLGALGY